MDNKKSSSSSCPAISTDISDPISPHLPIDHCFWQVLKATSRIVAAVCRFELNVLPLLVHVRGSTEIITYELVPTSPAVSCMSGSSNFDCFRDGW